MSPNAALAGTLIFLIAVLGACSDGEEPALDVEPTTAITPDLQSPSHLAPPDERLRFESGVLRWDGPDISEPTTLAFGPDGRLYVGQLNGQIVALTLDQQTVTNADLIADADTFESVLGLAFNPVGAVEPITLYVSHTLLYGGADGPAFAGAIAKLTAPEFRSEEIITGLPVSNAEHGTNGMAFDSQGRLFIAQGGTTNAGVPSERFDRAETPLSGAILVADIADLEFDGSIGHDPANVASNATDQVAGDVQVFASGFRNPYDIVVHSNGFIYATDNGPNGQDGLQSVTCTSDDTGPTHPDELNLVSEGGYYGHPNRNRGRHDERQCAYQAADQSLPDGTGPIATLGFFVSADGMIEYHSESFDGLLQNNLIYVEWAQGRAWRVVLTRDGLGVVSISQLLPGRMKRPLDIAEGPDGTLYIAEMDADRISFFRPMPYGE